MVVHHSTTATEPVESHGAATTGRPNAMAHRSPIQIRPRNHVHTTAQPLSSPHRIDRALLADLVTRSCVPHTSAQLGRGIFTATKQHVARWLLVAVSSVNRLIRHRRPCCVLVTGTNKPGPRAHPLSFTPLQSNPSSRLCMGRERDAVYPPRVVPPLSVSAPHTHIHTTVASTRC
jgi:hypothetical protein